VSISVRRVRRPTTRGSDDEYLMLGLTRFDDFQESLGIARNVLTDRLNRLVEEGIFERVLYHERPARYEYRLTQTGSDLFTALNALRQWGDQYLSPKPMRLLRRKADKTPVVAALIPEGAPVLAADEIELVPGPGFRATPGAGDPARPRFAGLALRLLFVKVFNAYGEDWDRTQDREGWRSKQGFLGEHVGSELLGGSVYELEPGDRLWPYHTHRADEGWLVVLRGEPTLRTPEGEQILREGDVVCFLRGKEGAHQVSNRTGSPIRVLMLSTAIDPDILEYLDSGKIGAWKRERRGNHAESPRPDARQLGRRGLALHEGLQSARRRVGSR
jgi:uncharacterized cupin superfamily protein/DNA-binding HxlR family transcriptional regulator